MPVPKRIGEPSEFDRQIAPPVTLGEVIDPDRKLRDPLPEDAGDSSPPETKDHP